MTSPHPFSKPRRSRRRRKVILLAPSEWGRVYAPRGGTVRQKGEWAVITTPSGWKHKLRNVHVKNRLDGQRVSEGEWIGRHTGRTIRYVRRAPDGDLRDAMTVVRDPLKWMHGARRLPATDAGEMNGGGSERAAVMHTTESNHQFGTINAVARWCVSQRIAYTGLLNPWTGETVQMYPGHVAARSLLNDGSYATNRHGKIRQQWSLVGKTADRPMSGGSPLKGWIDLVAYLCSWGVPLKAIDDRRRSRESWGKSGWHTHASCPGNDHGDPGRVDWAHVFSPAYLASLK